ncbi:EAL domain-containing protein [Marinicrinis sediminis]|uniref:EAL domain-containing protein n=1 Tax=Marinicrinis sediminis TaxID=1652465 RepID=A0ABW5R979_9BACL
MNHNMHMHGTYDLELVLFSYIIAVFASYTALDLAGRVRLSKGGRRVTWLLLGAIVMGMGIWSMHFVGMMAFSLPVPIVYDLVVVLISVVAALLAAFITLYIVSRERVTVVGVLVGGLLLAIGISSMHYIGMAAITIHITYDPMMFVLSIVIAGLASIGALAFSFYFSQDQSGRGFWKKLGSGVMMGIAIAGMHYVGMIAANFHISQKSPPFFGIDLEQKYLGYIITGGTLFTLVMSLIGIYVSKRLTIKDSEARQSEKWFRSLFQNNQDGIITIDLNRRIVGFNEAASTMTGYDGSQFMHEPIETISALIPEADRDRIRQLFQQSFTGKSISYEADMIHKQGHLISLYVVVVPVTIENEVNGIFIIAKDVTAEKKSKELIQHLAYHDELTGLPNRRMFNERLDARITQHQEANTRFAVMVLDIDRFKMINDSLGHMYGDLFLKEVSERIRQVVIDRPICLARIGGDEFTLMVEQFDQLTEVSAIADELIHQIQQPYSLMETDFYVTASIGITVYPDHGIDSGQLLKHADSAMYEVKREGKNGYCYYSAELNQQLIEKIELERDLRKAVQNEELFLHYQPQIQTEGQRMIGVEALIRWQHPAKGVLSPGVFIPIAEETGIIYEIGSWILREACRQMKDWHDAGGPLIPISVNLSSQQFHQSNLAAHVQQILEETGLEPKYLELEITESMMMDANTSISILNELHQLGVRISLDDFGTGYSSLSYLKMFPIQKLKIDRSFIQDITVNRNDKAIVSTIIAMAQHLNMSVIAEGIESKEQLDVLTLNDCREIQGYYFSKPLSAWDVEQQFFVPQRAVQR